MTTAPISDQSDPKRPARNIFEDPAIQEAAESDAFIRFVREHWKTLLVTLVAIAGAMIAYNIFQTTADNKRADATDKLVAIQESYQSLLSTQENLEQARQRSATASDDKTRQELSGKIDAATKELQESRTKIGLMIDSLDGPKPFDSLASLYKGLVAGRFKDYAATRSVLQNTPWEQVGAPESTERYVAEMVTLGLAKVLAESEPDRATARESLRALSERGKFVAVEAVSALSVLAASPEEKNATKELIAQVKTRFPQDERYLGEALERLSN